MAVFFWGKWMMIRVLNRANMILFQYKDFFPVFVYRINLMNDFIEIMLLRDYGVSSLLLILACFSCFTCVLNGIGGGGHQANLV